MRASSVVVIIILAAAAIVAHPTLAQQDLNNSAIAAQRPAAQSPGTGGNEAAPTKVTPPALPATSAMAPAAGSTGGGMLRLGRAGRGRGMGRARLARGRGHSNDEYAKAASDELDTLLARRLKNICRGC